MKRKSTVFMLTVLAGLAIFVAIPAAGQYKQINLVADQPGIARYTDTNLLDPWGMLFLPEGGFLIADAHSGLATTYAAGGKPKTRTVSVPPAPSLPFGPVGSPTGVVANRTSEFRISKGGESAPAWFIFDTLDGTIGGWSPEVDPAQAIIVVDNSIEYPFPASYTALAFARNSKGQNVIYAADSGSGPDTSNNRIDMFDAGFNYLGSFGDPNPPPNMTVFNVQAVDHKLYVTYAAFTLLQGGVVDIFDTDGNFVKRFAENDGSGPLQEPWPLADAPSNFGEFSSALLIGNLEDGRINAYNRKTGAFLGQLTDNNGNPISNGLGLWTLGFRPDQDQDHPARLYFTTGTNGEADGLFGTIVPVGH
jgi:uncharacterized protein (TIGR03118 family)